MPLEAEDRIVEGRRHGWGGFISRSALFIAFLAWSVAFALALGIGAVRDAEGQVLSAILLELRLPRALLASAVGMGLAVAGVGLQAVFANPLCEPYTLGISSGATLGAVSALAFGLQGMVAGLALPAFAGGLVFAVILRFLSSRLGGRGSGLLLAGVMLGFVGSSLVSLVLALTDSNGLQGAILWLMGDLSRARLEGTLVVAVSCLALSLPVWARSRQLDALLLGEEQALAVGVDAARVRSRMVLLTSLLVGLTVSAGGMIGFVGMVVPHLARRWVGSLHGRLIPVAAVLGAATLTAADALARWVARPTELPVGVVTALLGAPLFLLIALGSRRSGS